MKNLKLNFFIFWAILLSLAPVTVYLNGFYTPLNTIQRLTGLWVFTLLFVQIILGSFMTQITEKLGGWIYRFHIFQGFLIYFLILMHMLSFVFISYFAGKSFDPFYVFVDVCVLCNNKFEYYFNFGRVAFWFITLAVFAGFFRTFHPFLRVHWRKFHVLNYFAFILVGAHSLFVGSDIGTFPFSIIHGPSLLVATGILVVKAKGAISFLKKLLN